MARRDDLPPYPFGSFSEGNNMKRDEAADDRLTEQEQQRPASHFNTLNVIDENEYLERRRPVARKRRDYNSNQSSYQPYDNSREAYRPSSYSASDDYGERSDYARDYERRIYDDSYRRSVDEREYDASTRTPASSPGTQSLRPPDSSRTGAFPVHRKSAYEEIGRADDKRSSDYDSSARRSRFKEDSAIFKANDEKLKDIGEELELCDSLIKELKEYVAETKVQKLSKKAVIDKDELMAKITAIEKALPKTIQKAAFIIESAKSIMGSAREASADLLRKTEKEAGELASEDEITRLAYEKAREYAAEMEMMRQETEQYIEDQYNYLLMAINDVGQYGAQSLNSIIDRVENEKRERLYYSRDEHDGNRGV